MTRDEVPELGAICCGRRLRCVAIEPDRLLFTYCARCEVIRWFADGIAVERENALELVGLAGRAATRRRPAPSRR
jgi:hypothetical protein